MKNKVSKESQEQALKMAKGIQKVGQTKEQTKLISQGIEKGIAEYKKQQKKLAREKDKQRKKTIKAKEEVITQLEVNPVSTSIGEAKIPWALLVLSWLGFIGYHFI